MQETTPISFYDFCKHFSGVTPLWVCIEAYREYCSFMRSKFKQMSVQSSDTTHLSEKINAVKWSNSWPEVGGIIITHHVK